MSAGIILTTQFTVPTAKSFSNYLNYVTREQALLNKEIRTPDEELELEKVQSHINQTKIEQGESISSIDHKRNLNSLEKKAKDMITDDSVVVDDFTKYVTYMAREYALEQKLNLTDSEQTELLKVRKQMLLYDPKPQQANTKLNGVFTNSKTELSKNDLPEISKQFANAQKNGSILFQDVISHDNSFLAELGVYDSKTDTLNEQALIQAGTAMMDELIKKEGLEDTAFWIGSIHRNTKHIHIHFALTEVSNTREYKQIKENGVEYYQPKGTRKQSTLDSMKATYGRELRDYALGNERIKKLERKSDLRNELTKEIKKELYESKVNLKLLNEIYQELPEKKSHWNYGTQQKSQLPESVRLKIDQLTTSIVGDNDHYKEYMTLLQDEQKMKIKMFGETTQKEKDQLQNELFNIKQRLGNSLLTELKKQDSQFFNLLDEKKQAQTTLVYQLDQRGKSVDWSKEGISRNTEKESSSFVQPKRKISQSSSLKRPLLTNRSLKKLSYTINKATNKQQELYQYELMKRRIQLEQNRR